MTGTLVTQEEINAFAEATGDHQWIHVDPERAKNGPFGGTIAHGYWTLSAAPFISRGGEGKIRCACPAVWASTTA